MTTRARHDQVMSRWDAVSMAIFMVVGAAFAVFTVVNSIIRTAEVLANQDVRVFARFNGTMADAPIGPDGTPVPVELDTAFLIAPQLPAASVGALVIEQLVVVVAVVTVIGCLLLLTWKVLHGRVFGRANTQLVATAGIVGFFGVALAPFLANMGANGAFARLSDGTFDNVVLAADLSQLFIVAFVAALAATTFTVGERLQRDTEGLV